MPEMPAYDQHVKNDRLIGCSLALGRVQQRYPYGSP